MLKKYFLLEVVKNICASIVQVQPHSEAAKLRNRLVLRGSGGTLVDKLQELQNRAA